MKTATLATLLLVLASPAAQAQAQSPAAYSAFPCLSRTLPCGSMATRAPVLKALQGTLDGNAQRGREIAAARNRGNCLACHMMAGGTQPGTRGPDLSRYGATGRDDAQTYAFVFDMRAVNPQTLMPPFGTNEILTDQEIRDVVAFLQSSR